MAVPAHVEGDDADGIPGDEEGLALGIVEHEGEDAVHAVEEIFGLQLVVEVEDDLAVREGLEVVALFQALLEFLVVVDLPVDRQHRAFEGVHQGLGPVLHVHDGKALVDQDRVVIAVDAAPVWAPVPDLPGHGQGLAAQLGRVGPGGVDAEDGEDAAHGNSTGKGKTPIRLRESGWSGVSGILGETLAGPRAIRAREPIGIAVGPLEGDGHGLPTATT